MFHIQEGRVVQREDISAEVEARREDPALGADPRFAARREAYEAEIRAQGKVSVAVVVRCVLGFNNDDEGRLTTTILLKRVLIVTTTMMISREILLGRMWGKHITGKIIRFGYF